MKHKYKIGDVVKVKVVYHKGDHYNKTGIITGNIFGPFGDSCYYHVIIAGIEGKTYNIHESNIESKL